MEIIRTFLPVSDFVGSAALGADERCPNKVIRAFRKGFVNCKNDLLFEPVRKTLFTKGGNQDLPFIFMVTVPLATGADNNQNLPS